MLIKVMVEDLKIEGNFALDIEELEKLRIAVLNKLFELTGYRIENPDKILNSNLKNYKILYESINKVVALKAQGIRSAKPLAGLFHFSKTNEKEYTSFRKKFINALYEYAFGQSREDYILGNTKYREKSGNISTDQIYKIEGFWESFYDKDNKFAETFRNHNEASLSIFAILIKRNLKDNNIIVEYHSKLDSGVGTIEAQGANFVFNLRSNRNSEPTIMFMNFVSNIERATNHFKNAVGIFLHINESECPKSGKCVMIYMDEEKFEKKYNCKYGNLNDETFKNQFVGELKISSTNELSKNEDRLKLFFSKGNNTTDVHISHFTSVTLTN